MMQLLPRSRLALAVGAGLVLAYWLHLSPPGLGRLGRARDLGEAELTRQLMADSLTEVGGPSFTTTRLMAPDGVSTAYFSWSMERDWIGAYVWRWNPDFPYLWFYFGCSLLVSYFAVGLLTRKLGLPAWAAWSLASLVVIFNTPRQYKTYQHFEHITLHWVYVAVFLDALIWRRFWKDRRWSWPLELWRGVVMAMTFGAAGYYWGAMTMEWAVVRLSMLGMIVRRGKRHQTRIEGSARQAIWPVAVGCVYAAVAARWFIPLAREVWLLGSVSQPSGWSASLLSVVRPLWFETLMLPARLTSPSVFSLLQRAVQPYPETLVTAGWTYWIPAMAGVWLVGRRRGGAGFGSVFPFLAFLILAVLYVGIGPPFVLQAVIQHVVPFMAYFRVLSRMGLLLVPVLGAIIALAWPELSDAFRRRWMAADHGPRQRFRIAAAAFAVSSILEFAHLGLPPTIMPVMDPATAGTLAALRETPGTTVLDLPFCVIGGNGSCAGFLNKVATPAVALVDQCPNYPLSVAPAYLSGYHDKKVYGVYLGRLVESQCESYNREPYLSWFDAWREQRCLTDDEWKGFCRYLGDHAELSAVLVYPGIWRGAADPACRAKFDQYLGAPRAEVPILADVARSGTPAGETPLLWYGARCQN